MSKAMINSLIDEINSLLSRPVGSVTKRVSVDIVHPRDQLKSLRAHLEKLTEDNHLNNLDQQYQSLIAHLQEKISINCQTSHDISTESKKLEILSPTTVKIDRSGEKQIRTVKEFADLIGDVSELWEFLKNRQVSTGSSGFEGISKTNERGKLTI